MKLAVFGATGRTGRRVVASALSRGWEVRALARDPAKLGEFGGEERLEVVRGDVLDAAAVERVVAGCEAVVSVLGHVKGSPKDVQTRGTQNIVRAMERTGVRRIVSLTGAGVRDSRDRPKLVDRVFAFLLARLQKDVLEDGERHVEVLRRSGLEWTVVRGPRLTEGERRGEYRVGYVGKESGTQISRADLAEFMLDQVSDTTYLRRMPVASY
ncbi:Putative NADH-flavin reductase (plasmid) [Rubrobacter radiotolerans]|uniref:Putative NADH-flavin reductase n=1 Tax=Rubrobacter radiotolerans TaxID=42256 RepID=A0A023X7T3_RUBRA|nr:SDR family oxidoreductase [Rubrobacter radiotolerans]AHY48276.1 Putative NADH-flavin reductase [Rubrobacter radiotolerans]MDX5895549.1 SDR family oxidoreductase [Rubrobacter radiotolerans]SMC01473.1 Putative NADH-flavin reductase [Rubrobacter radiotolerans DSM 5868]